MKTAIVPKYGPPEVIRLEDRTIPTPKPGEVLVRIHASTVTTGDWRLRAAAYPKGLRLIGRLVSGLRKPRKSEPGVTFSGVVAGLGDGVTRFALGDAVFGTSDGGGHADYIALPQTAALAHKPDRLDHAEAASLPFGAATALYFLDTLGKVGPGDRVLVTGASGAVGHMGVQVAKALGAEVTALGSQRNAAFLTDLGADTVLAYETDDLTDLRTRFDAILDPIGLLPFKTARPMLARNGRLLTVEAGVREMVQSLAPVRRHGHAIRFGVSMPDADDLARLAQMAEAGQITPRIEARFPLTRIVEAHRAVETRHRQGVIALEMVQD